MQNKLHQLVMIALKRNGVTTNLPLEISMRHYQVTVSGTVSSARLVQEVIETIESVSPYLYVTSQLEVQEPAFA